MNIKINKAFRVLENMQNELTHSQYERIYISLENIRREYEFLNDQAKMIEIFDSKKRKRDEYVINEQKDEIESLRKKTELLEKQKTDLEKELETGFYFNPSDEKKSWWPSLPLFSELPSTGRSLFKPRSVSLDKSKLKKCLFCPTYVKDGEAMCYSCSQRTKRRKN